MDSVLQLREHQELDVDDKVAILVLVDSVLQCVEYPSSLPLTESNPCFSGQCFAILIVLTSNDLFKYVAILVLVDSVLQYKNLLCFSIP